MLNIYRYLYTNKIGDWMLVTSLVIHLYVSGWMVVVWCHGLTPCWLPQDGRLALHYAAARKETLPIYTALINAGTCSLELPTKFRGTNTCRRHLLTQLWVFIYEFPKCAKLPRKNAGARRCLIWILRNLPRNFVNTFNCSTLWFFRARCTGSGW